MQSYVPVISSTDKPRMPTTHRKADKLIAKGRAIRRFNRGLFYIQLVDRADGYTQPITVGIDPGSQKEACTAHTYLNRQADAVTWVSQAEKTSTQMRRTRRSRKTPYRKMRNNRRQGHFRLPPSTRARWRWKLRLCTWLAHCLPITSVMVEDIKARTKPRWNKAFSPLEVGKTWFDQQLSTIAPVHTQGGDDTKLARDRLGLKKSKQKTSDHFNAHCVDAWVLANPLTGGHDAPDNRSILYLVPLRFHRRQLHRMKPDQGGVRSPYGGTLSLGFKRGAWVNHPQYGTCYVGGTANNRLSLHRLQTGARLCINAKPQDLTFLCTASWRLRKGENASSAR